MNKTVLFLIDFQVLSNSSFVSNISGSENYPSSGSDVDTVTLKGLSLKDTVNIVTFGDVVIESLNVDPQIDAAFVCTICRGVPSEPVITSCNHIFCSSCIRSWIRVASACPVCRFCIDETDIIPLNENLLFIYDSLMVKCTYTKCQTKVSLRNIKVHEMSCQHAAAVQIYNAQKIK